MIYLGSIFSHLPNELTGKILDSCEARDLGTLPQVCSSNDVTQALTTDAWKRFEAGLGYSSGERVEEGPSVMDPNSLRFKEFNKFVKDLVVRIESYTEVVPADIQEIVNLAMEKAPTAAQVGKLQAFIQARDLVVRIKNYPEEVPADIQEIVDLAMEKAPTAEQVGKLQAFVKAIDTLVVWQKVSDAFLLVLVCVLQNIKSVDDAIERARDFSLWMEENYKSLQTLTELDLSGSHLTSLPKELGQLHNLKRLNLQTNQLISIPKELGQLHNLRTLNLNYNQLRSIPESVKALPAEILIEGNPCASTVEEPEEEVPITAETSVVLPEEPVVTFPSVE